MKITLRLPKALSEFPSHNLMRPSSLVRVMEFGISVSPWEQTILTGSWYLTLPFLSLVNFTSSSRCPLAMALLFFGFYFDIDDVLDAI